MELGLIDIPPEVQIKSTIRPGSVYYFTEESFSSPEPHYFIVINTNPQSDTAIFLVCASSQIPRVKTRRKMCPSQTLVEIDPGQYPDFKWPSVVDCNHVAEKNIDQLVEKLSEGKLKFKTEMDVILVEQLRDGVMQSPMVERRIKVLLQGLST